MVYLIVRVRILVVLMIVVMVRMVVLVGDDVDVELLGVLM